MFPEVLKQIYQNTKNLIIYRCDICLPGNNVVGLPQPSNNANGFEHFFLNGLKKFISVYQEKHCNFKTEHYKKIKWYVCFVKTCL
jgi:hypothetical protein